MKHLGNKILTVGALFIGALLLVFNTIEHIDANFNATDVLGHVDVSGNPQFNKNYTNNGLGSVNDQGFDAPDGMVVDPLQHRLFVSDNNNNRVLVFNLDVNNEIIDRTADFVLGQPDFTSNAVNQGLPTPTASTLWDPTGLDYTNSNKLLFVSDSNNNRILVYDVASITNGEPAIDVIGQADFVSGTVNRGGSQTAQTLNNPGGVSYDSSGQRLFVADYENDRVLVFDMSVGGDRAAINVLGKPTFTNTTLGFAAQNKMNHPAGLKYDYVHDRLFVAEFQNRRVTIFDVRPSGSPALSLCPLIDPATTTGIADGMNASCLIGQPTWGSNNASGNDGLSGSNFQHLYGIAYNPASELLYVVEQASRVLIFDINTIDIYPTESAIAVFGEPDFATAVGRTQAYGMNNPHAVAYNPANDEFFVSDTANHRVLVFEFIKITSTSMPNGTVGINYTQPVNYTDSQGIVSMQLMSGSLPPGLAFSGTSITGMPTVPGTYTFTIRGADDSGGSGIFYSPPVTLSITIDLLPAGFTMGSISGNTAESGTSATFTIALNSPTLPGEDVTINLSSSDITEGTVSPTSVTFTNGNWNIPQTITVTGVDDVVADGNIPYSVITSNTVSTYSEYDNVSVPDVGLVNIDDDIPNYIFSPINRHTTEALGTATFTMKLATQPTGNVTIPLSSSDITEGTVSPASVTFTTFNWSINQTVTVTGVDDSIDDGDVPYTIITGAAVTADSVYGPMVTPDVSVINDDDGDAAGVTVSLISNDTTEAGATATFSAVLDSQPTGDVTFSLISSDTTEGVITDSSLTFTALNWNVPQIVTVTGVDDSIDDGDVAYSIITGDGVSTDANYQDFIIDDIDALNIDNDEPIRTGGGGVMIIEQFDLIVLRQPTPTTADLQFVVSSAGGGSTINWLMVYSTNPNELATLTKVPWTPQINGVPVPRGATRMYVQYFDAANPNHKSQIISKPLQSFEQDDQDEPIDTSSCTPYLTSYMSIGGMNDSLEVVKLQTFLRDEEGFSAVHTSGVYDRATYNAVVNFQERYFDEVLSPWFNQHGTGRVFVTTKKKINEIHCARQSKPLKECRPFNTYAKLGEENSPEEVRKIQDFLKNELFLTNDSSTSGLFDVMLDDAVRKFQASYPDDIITPWGDRNQESNGWWYVTTQAKANQLYCAKNPSL